MIFNWWKRHPKYRMRLWLACASTEDIRHEVEHGCMRAQFRRDAEQAWRER